LTNLVSNALKFTERGMVEVGYSEGNDFLEFYVKDTGIGIAPEYHEDIFERFWRVDHTDLTLFRGLGIGLTLSRSFVKLMGGNIWLHSEPGIGSTFYFTIPFKKVSSVIAPKKGNEKVNLNNHIILICEDDETNLYYFKELFSKTNTFVLWAKNGNEAVKSVKENPNIDLVLMDLKMPEMNGWEATKIIKTIRPDLPVIAQTAHALIIETSQLTTKGFDDYVTKPIKKDELFEKISRYID
jgi:CheY-like chemotaxis protein